MSWECLGSFIQHIYESNGKKMRYVLIKEQSQITEIIPFYDPGLQRVLAYDPHPGYTGFY